MIGTEVLASSHLSRLRPVVLLTGAGTLTTERIDGSDGRRVTLGGR